MHASRCSFGCSRRRPSRGTSRSTAGLGAAERRASGRMSRTRAFEFVRAFGCGHILTRSLSMCNCVHRPNSPCRKSRAQSLAVTPPCSHWAHFTRSQQRLRLSRYEDPLELRYGRRAASSVDRVAPEGTRDAKTALKKGLESGLTQPPKEVGWCFQTATERPGADPCFCS